MSIDMPSISHFNLILTTIVWTRVIWLYCNYFKLWAVCNLASYGFHCWCVDDCVCEIISAVKKWTEYSEIPHMWVTHQVLEHEGKRLLSVDDVMKSHNIGVFQVLQQRHYRDTERDRLFLKHVAFMNIH